MLVKPQNVFSDVIIVDTVDMTVSPVFGDCTLLERLVTPTYLENCFSSKQKKQTAYGIHRGSILGPVLFNPNLQGLTQQEETS